MGKGDTGTRRGKIWRGSYGNTRPHKTDNHTDNHHPPSTRPVAKSAAPRTRGK
jgi:30S ribosomal protein S31